MDAVTVVGAIIQSQAMQCTPDNLLLIVRMGANPIHVFN